LYQDCIKVNQIIVRKEKTIEVRIGKKYSSKKIERK